MCTAGLVAEPNFLKKNDTETNQTLCNQKYKYLCKYAKKQKHCITSSNIYFFFHALLYTVPVPFCYVLNALDDLPLHGVLVCV